MLDVLYLSLNLTSQFSICLYLHILCLFCNQWNGLVPDVLLHIKDNPRSEMHVLRSKRANVPLSGENMCGQSLCPYTYKVATAKLNVRVHFSLQILCPCDNVSSDPNSSLAVISFTSCNFYKCPLNVCKQQPCSNGTEKQQRKHRFVFRQNYCF